MNNPHCIHRADPDEARAALDAEVADRCRLAFDAGCRLAITTVRCETGCCWAYDFVVLSPGESAPAGWTVYEERGGVAVGRSS
jgi:hypothetical protein